MLSVDDERLAADEPLVTDDPGADDAFYAGDEPVIRDKPDAYDDPFVGDVFDSSEDFFAT